MIIINDFDNKTSNIIIKSENTTQLIILFIIKKE